METRIPRVPKIPLQSALLNASLDSTDDVLSFPVKNSQEKKSSEESVSISLPEMDFDRMKDFSEHRFKLYTGKRLEDMVNSVQLYGILQPLILWHTNGEFILLSGYNRRNAGRLAGLTKAPVIIKEDISLTDAILIMTETNLRQRSFADLSESERAFCLKQHYDAMKSQGRRNDILKEIEELLDSSDSKENQTSSETVTKLRSDEKLGNEYGLNRDKVAKYIRIAGLIEPLINRLDRKDITFQCAYDISFIEDSMLQEKLELQLEAGHRLDKKKAELLRLHAKEHRLTLELIESIMSGEKTIKPSYSGSKPIHIKPTLISRYFAPTQSRKEIESTIEKALEFYFEQKDSVEKEQEIIP